MIVFILLSTAAANLCLALPNIYDVDPQNVVTVPPNCPAGQEWINGECRDVWIALSSGAKDYPANSEFVSDYGFEPQNAVSAPPNCVSNQVWVNGQCRDVWRSGVDVNGIPHNMVTVPPNCPPGQEYINGACREIWRATGLQSVGASASDPIMQSNLVKALLKSVIYEDDDIVGTSKNIIGVPNQCPAGYKPDALGYCREIYD